MSWVRILLCRGLQALLEMFSMGVQDVEEFQERLNLELGGLEVSPQHRRPLPFLLSISHLSAPSVLHGYPRALTQKNVHDACISVKYKRMLNSHLHART